MPRNKIIKCESDCDAEPAAEAAASYIFVQYVNENHHYAGMQQQLRQECGNDRKTLQPTYQLADGSSVFRPLTFRETIQACVDNFNREYDLSGMKRPLEERIRPFADPIASCSAIAYKAATGRIRIAPICQALVEADNKFEKDLLPIDYNLIDGVEIDTYKEGYGPLEVWNALLEEDSRLLAEYGRIIAPISVMLCKDKDKSSFNKNRWQNVLLQGIQVEDVLAPAVKCGATYQEGVKNAFSHINLLRVSQTDR